MGGGDPPLAKFQEPAVNEVTQPRDIGLIALLMVLPSCAKTGLVHASTPSRQRVLGPRKRSSVSAPMTPGRQAKRIFFQHAATVLSFNESLGCVVVWCHTEVRGLAYQLFSGP